MRFDSESLQAISHALFEKREALPEKTRLLRVHQHVGLDLEQLNNLELTFPNFTTTKFVSCFVDTKNFDLARANMWLVYQDNRWTLKSCKGTSTDENFVIFHSEQNLGKIEDQVAPLLGAQQAPISELCPNRYAVIRTTRRTYLSSPSCSLYFDCAEVARNDFYLVGTISLTAKNNALDASAWPQLPSRFSPVRSRVAESLYINRKGIYDELVQAGVLPACAFFSHHDLNRFKSNLFAQPPDEVLLTLDNSPQCRTKPESFPIPDPLPSSKKQEAHLIAWNNF